MVDEKVGSVLVRKSNAAVLASAWKKRTLRLSSTLLVWGRSGAATTSVKLSEVVDAKLLSRYGEFAVDLASGSTIVFRVKGVRAATSWIVAIKERRPDHRESTTEWPAGDWPASDSAERQSSFQDDDNTSSVSATPRLQEKGDVVGAPAVFQPQSWAEVEPNLWWRNDETKITNDDDDEAPGGLVAPTEAAAADPLGLAPDDVLEGISRQKADVRLTEPEFDPDAFLACVHAHASFAQLQAGWHNLQARLGSHDRKLQVVVRDNLASFLKGADKIHRFTIAFDKLITRARTGVLPPDGGLSLFDRLATHAFQCICDRFEPFLGLLDKTASLERATSLLVLFAPLVDGPDRPPTSQRRWSNAVAQAASTA